MDMRMMKALFMVVYTCVAVSTTLLIAAIIFCVCAYKKAKVISLAQHRE